MRSESDARGRIVDMLDAIAGISFCIDDQVVWATATANVLPLVAPLRRLHDLL